MNRNRHIFNDDDDDDDLPSWSRNRNIKGTVRRNRRNGVSVDPLGDVMAVVEDTWRETLDENFHPITLALDMLDSSSVGRAKDLDDFKQTNKQIEQALQSTVNEHYQGFNSSIGTYGQIAGSISSSQRHVSNTRDALLKAKVQLSSKRMDLLEMSVRTSQLQDMVKLLNDIAELKKVPEQLESLLSSKHFIHAVELLNSATSTANRDDMTEIAATSDIRQYLKSQAVSMVEILVEELHNHLYLKSPYCDGRWVTYVPGQVELPIVNDDEHQATDEKQNRKYGSTGSLQLDVFRGKRSTDQSALETLDGQHPESDSFHYIHIIVHALYAMGKLPYAIEMMCNRLPTEVYQIVDRTITDVKIRHPSTALPTFSIKQLLRTDLDEDYPQVLRDFLWTIFSKLDAMLQAHRVLYDAAGLLQSRSSLKGMDSQMPAGAYDFSEIWRPLESELKSILVDYLTEGQGAGDRHGKQHTTEDFLSARTVREKTRPVYSILNADSQGASTFGLEEQELRDMLQGSVPGLLSEKNDRSIVTKLVADDGSIGSHPRLCAATPFNISVLLQPTLAFLERAKRIVPNTATINPTNLSSFLDHFLQRTFGPQLSEAVEIMYRDALGDADKAKPDLSSTQNGIYAETQKVLDLILQLSSLLSDIPSTQADYSQTILYAIRQYLQRCRECLSIINANEKIDSHLGALKLGAAWSQRREVRDTWDTYYGRMTTERDLKKTVASELVALFSIKAGFTIRQEDLMQDPASVEALVNLYHSVTYFWKTVEALRPKIDHADPTVLRMSSDTSKRFDELLDSHKELSRAVLLTVRLELRTHVLYYLQLTLSHGNYNIEEKANEIDSTLADLNSDLLTLTSTLVSLEPEDYRMVLAGLADLVNEVLVEDSSSISVMTEFGADKLVLGIVALQQNLRNLASDPSEADLLRAVTFYQMFSLGPLGLCDRAATHSLPITYTQGAKLMTLMYSVGMHRKDSRNRDSVSIQKRQLNEHLALLSSQMSQAI